MPDYLIFLKAAFWLVVGYGLLRGWQRRRARNLPDDPWTRIEHR